MVVCVMQRKTTSVFLSATTYIGHFICIHLQEYTQVHRSKHKYIQVHTQTKSTLQVSHYKQLTLRNTCAPFDTGPSEQWLSLSPSGSAFIFPTPISSYKATLSPPGDWLATQFVGRFHLSLTKHIGYSDICK